MFDHHFLKNSISCGSWGPSDTGKNDVNGSSSLDLGANKCDLTDVFLAKSNCSWTVILSFQGLEMWFRLRSRAWTWLLHFQHMIVILSEYVAVGGHTNSKSCSWGPCCCKQVGQHFTFPPLRRLFRKDESNPPGRFLDFSLRIIMKRKVPYCTSVYPYLESRMHQLRWLFKRCSRAVLDRTFSPRVERKRSCLLPLPYSSHTQLIAQCLA
jgi:hypothetical protein